MSRPSVSTDEDRAEIDAVAFLMWVQFQFTCAPCQRITWTDATHEERKLATDEAAKFLGYEV